MRSTTTADQRIARVAARHHGLVTRANALSCGLTDRQIEMRIRTGRWERIVPGVYRLAGAPETPAQVAYAAVLAAGDGARVCGVTALGLLGVGHPPKVPHITVPPTSSARTAGALVRRSPVGTADRSRIGPIPSTAPGRALLEASRYLDGAGIEQLVDDVIHATLATPSTILGAIRRAPVGQGRSGATALMRALEPWTTGIRPGSPGEVRLLRRIDDWGLPEPHLQHVVRLPEGRRAIIDVAWPEHLVGLEYDGGRHHGPRRLAADVEREEKLRAAGWWIGRVDRHDLAPSSTRVRDELLQRIRSIAA